MYQRMPLLGWGEMEFILINEELEYFEEDVIREGPDCHLLMKWAYTTQSQ